MVEKSAFDRMSSMSLLFSIKITAVFYSVCLEAMISEVMPALCVQTAMIAMMSMG